MRKGARDNVNSITVIDVCKFISRCDSLIANCSMDCLGKKIKANLELIGKRKIILNDGGEHRKIGQSAYGAH